MRYCDNCGHKLREDDVFCQQCGHKAGEPLGNRIASGKTGPPGTRRSNVSAVIICAVVFLCVCGLILWYIFKPESSGSGERTAASHVEGAVLSDTAAAAELTAEPGSLSPYHKVPAVSSGASSVVRQEGHDNTAAMTLDGLDETSWQEGAAGPGIGQQIWYELDGTYDIKYLSFKLGNWRGSSYYAGNHRPRVLRITAGGVTGDVTFPDGMEEYWVTLSNSCKADRIVLEIRDVYEGNKWDETCIAEVGIYGKQEEPK